LIIRRIERETIKKNILLSSIKLINQFINKEESLGDKFIIKIIGFLIKINKFNNHISKVNDKVK
jgi:hypothetical protein